jgi:hypothetical protein
MSTNPSQPTPDPKETANGSSARVSEATETDLWDLDPDDKGFTPTTRRQIDPPPVEAIKPVEPAGEPPDTDPEISAQASGDEAITEEGQETEPRPALPAITSMSNLEKIAVSCLFAALALGATLTLVHFSKQVPTRPSVAAKISYPVKGEIVEIKSASTFWRAPVTTGEDIDVVRRGTRLIPTLKMSLTGKSGVIRVFFRNEDGLVVGDGITRAISGDTELSVAATAGFDDIGMHTAYRTGDSLPWVVQVFEGPHANAPRDEFRMVMETEVSTSIR